MAQIEAVVDSGALYDPVPYEEGIRWEKWWWQRLDGNGGSDAMDVVDVTIAVVINVVAGHFSRIHPHVRSQVRMEVVHSAVDDGNHHPVASGGCVPGKIGVNVGIPAPVASLPFGGMRNSLFADIKGQGRAVIDFYTDAKIVTERYWPE